MRADAATWILSLIEKPGHPGQTIDEVIHDRLVATRTTLDRASHTDPQAIAKLNELVSVIADTADEPCLSTACIPGQGGADEIGSSRTPTWAAHAGWHWLCAP